MKAGLLSAAASGEREGFAYRGVCAGAERIGAVLGEAGRMPMMDFASLRVSYHTHPTTINTCGVGCPGAVVVSNSTYIHT